MRLRLRLPSVLLTVVAVVLGGFLSAPPAQAADLGAVTYTDGTSTLTPNTLADAQVGDTFQIQAVSAFSNYMVNGTGSASIGVNSCAEATPVYNSLCVLSYSPQTVTITALGTLRILNYLGETTATLTLGSGEAPSAGSGTASTLVASQPPSVTATPGNGVVQLSISPGTGGTGKAQLYGIKYLATSTCVAQRALAPRPIQDVDACGPCPAARALVPRPNFDALLACPRGSASVAAGASGSATTTITGLENGREYSFSVLQMTTDQLWSGATTVTSTPTAAATCSTLTVDVAQPAGKDASAVTTPVSGATAPAVYPFIAPPYGGTVKEPAMGAWTSASSTGAAGGEFATFTPTTDKPCPIAVTAPEGTKLSLSKGGAWNAGSASLTVYSGTPVHVFGTKTGDHTVAFSAGAGGALKVSPKVRIGTVPQAAYNVAVDPASQDLAASGFGRTKVSVTDVFGNPVAGAKVAVAATGQVLLAGYSASQDVTTGADGSQDVTIIAGSAAGQGSVTAAAPAVSTAWAWQTGYATPTGFPRPVTAAPSAVTVTAPASEKSIAITGERGTADVVLPSGETCRSYAEGPPARALPVGCVKVTGVTKGFAEGTAMTPEYRFPGQTSYTAGIDVTINADGEFTWYRKTGKKIYVRFVNGNVVSDRVIIPAK